MTKKTFSILMVALLAQFALAQAPSSYYSSTKGTSGRNLKTAMFKVISSHKDIGYDKLWSAFKDTDCRPDGKVWDMYSNTTNYTFGKDQDKGAHSAEGQTYNREHSFPKSWFNDARPMHNDLFHLYPTDSYINGIRSNYPFGETDRPKRSSKNGFSKFGPCSLPGYSGDVFEPNDEYKGDFARSYFYMATAYEDRISTFGGGMTNGTSYPCYKSWVIEMLLRWAKEDPVSEKETKRNNAVYSHQKNRNPYIDFPGLEQYVWGDKQNVAFDPNNYEGGSVTPTPTPNTVAAPQFSLASGVVAENTTLTISCSTPDAIIKYSINGGVELSGASPVNYVITQNVSIKAYAQKGENKSETVQANYTIGKQPIVGDGVFVKIDAAADLVIGRRYLIVCEEKNVAMAYQDKDVRSMTDVTISNGEIKTAVSEGDKPYALTLGGAAGAYTLLDAASNKYLSLSSNGNKLYSVEENKGTQSLWNITINGGLAEIANKAYAQRSIQYNSGSPRFACYESKQKPVSLFREELPAAIQYPKLESNGKVDVYTLGGKLLRDDVSAKDAVKGLPRGIYVVGGLKLIVR